jgi:hypothetical protein
MTMRSWLGIEPKQERIEAPFEIEGLGAPGLPAVRIPARSMLALTGSDTFSKHFFCDWLMGFVEVPGSRVAIRHGSALISAAPDRTRLAAVLGRSPLLYGETIQESLLYRTREVPKKELYALIEQLYGPSLRHRTDPKNPLLDPNGKPIPTQILTAREHLEIAQINIILQRTPIVVLDLSSELMAEALAEGFRPAPLLLDGTKTIIAILPPGKDAGWAEHVLGDRPFTRSLMF